MRARSPGSGSFRACRAGAVALVLVLGLGCGQNKRPAGGGGGATMRDRVEAHCDWTRRDFADIKAGYLADKDLLVSGGAVTPSYPLLLVREALFCGSLRGAAALPLLDRLHVGGQKLRELMHAADDSAPGSAERQAAVAVVDELAGVYRQLLALPIEE